VSIKKKRKKRKKKRKRKRKKKGAKLFCPLGFGWRFKKGQREEEHHIIIASTQRNLPARTQSGRSPSRQKGESQQTSKQERKTTTTLSFVFKQKPTRKKERNKQRCS
jgi:hypothetical protein